MQSSKLPTPFFYLLGIFLLILLLGLTGVFRPLRALAEKVLIIPAKEEVFAWQRFFKKDLGGCQLQNERETAELKTKIASLTEENQAQQRLLSSPLPKNWQFLSAKVIGTEGEKLIINKGREDGVLTGMVGLTGETYLGRVDEVSERLAKLKLPSFLEERLMVKIVSGQEKVGLGLGLLIGRGEGRMRVEQILSSEEVKAGTLVMTSVEGGDLLVAEVEEIVQSRGETFKSAMVRRLFNPEELNTIFLIRGKL